MGQKMKQNNGLNFLWLAVVVFIMDVITKYLVVHNFYLSQSVPLLPFFSITHIRNYGAAFGLFLGQRWLLVVIALIVSLLVIVFLYRSPAIERTTNVALSLVIGGGIGNLFERIHHGYVIDFLDFYLGEWHYPAFNIADSAICIGVVSLLFTHFRGVACRKK